MSRAQQYRLQFAQCRGDRLLFFASAAVALHAGIVAGLLWQQSQTATQTAEQQQSEPLSIEFVYLEPDQPAPPPETARRASVQSVAAGKQQLDRAINAGGTTQKVVEPIKVAAAPPRKPAASPAPAAPQSLTPIRAAQPAAENKSLTPTPAPKPAQPVVASPAAAPATPIAAAPPPSAPTPTEIPSPAAEPRIVEPSPQAAPSPTPLSVGEGLDGLVNPNRDSEAESGSVDALIEPVRGEYLDRVYAALIEHWQRFTTDAARQSRVRFVIDRSGQLVEVQLTQSSGSEVADRAAVEAVQAAAPFAPLPEQYLPEQLAVNFTFTHNVSATP